MKGLAGRLLIGGMLLGAGCGGREDHREYHFKGHIDGEWVHFYESKDGKRNTLKVIREDEQGNKVTWDYFDTSENNLKVDSVRLVAGEGGNSSTFSTDIESHPEMSLIQESFDRYLARIAIEKRR